MCENKSDVNAYCHECLFASTNVFASLCCSNIASKTVGWYQRACNDFKDRYSVIESKD